MPSPAERQRAQQRRAQVLQWRLAGWPFDQIAARLDPPVSMQRAHQLYRAALAQIVREPADDLIKAECERLDLLWRAVIARALAGSARHAEVAVRVLERRARLLGLDAPTRTEVRLSVEEVEALDAEIEGLLAASAGGALTEPSRHDLDPPTG